MDFMCGALRVGNLTVPSVEQRLQFRSFPTSFEAGIRTFVFLHVTRIS